MRKEIYENQGSSDTLPFHWEFGKEEITPVAFDLSRLARYDREGVEEFCRQWGLDIPKEQEKVQGKPTGKKKRERER